MSRFRPWKVRHVDLSEGIPAFTLEPGIQGLHVVFWWHDIPLGERAVTAEQLPMPEAQVKELALQAITPAVGDYLLERGFEAALPLAKGKKGPSTRPDLQALRAVEQPMEQLREQFARSSNALSGMTMSVVVCTRDRPEQLKGCLEAIRRLEEAPEEIVVVDNAPRTDAARRLVEQMPGVQYVLEARPGLSVARNSGLRSTTCEIVAFTDDDVRVHPYWIARLKRGFRDATVMAVTGLILPAELETEAQYMFQHGDSGYGWGYRALSFDGSYFEQMKDRGVPVWHIGAGANMAFRREIFDLVGAFDERLGAGASGCSEDSEMWYRILAAGWVCRYEPSAVVAHYHRRDVNGLNDQIYQYMRGHMAALLIQFDRHHHWGNLYRAFGILPAYYTRRLLRRVRRGFMPKRSTLSAEILGCVAGMKYFWKRRKDAVVSPIVERDERTSLCSSDL